MRIRKIFSKILICIACLLCLHGACFAFGNVPYGDVGDYGNWITEDNMEKFNSNLSEDMSTFQNKFNQNLQASDYVSIETRLGLAFMESISFIGKVLNPLIDFTILFLLVMYAFWVGLEAYKTIRESTDYKKVLYNIFEKGFKIAAWIIVLEFGPVEIFSYLIRPIIALGTYLSTTILNIVAQTYDITIYDSCPAIQRYVESNNPQMLLDATTAANIMCLPGRLSMYFYHAVSAAWGWMISGFAPGNSVTSIVVGAVCVVLFIKCIFKYAFMTLGVVADLFLTLLMLPFTAIAEAMPETSEKNYVGQIFTGFLKVFNTKKLSDIISVFINASVYFVSLSLVISICAALLTNIIPLSGHASFNFPSAMTTILCGSLVLYLAGKADELAKQIGGSINNSFGEQLQKDTKTLWGDLKNLRSMAYQDWIKKK